MFKRVCLWGAVAAMLPLFAFAAEPIATEEIEGLSVDARFDKTGDGIVDASDWAKMSADDKLSYARESLKALGENPDTLMLKGQTREQQYLNGLRSVYEKNSK
jgi:hypothetical protein